MKGTGYRDKVVWLTGASSGIGEQLAYLLYQQGAKLIISARNADKLAAVKEQCGDPENDIYPLALDLADTDRLPEKAREVLERFGHIDYLFHVAGVACRDLALNIAPEIDEQILKTNYLGPVILTKAVLPHMIRRGSGYLAVTSSLSGKCGVPKLSAYAASKHALHGFFDSLRSEVYDQNIRISILIPGIIRTPITVNALRGDGNAYGKMLKVQAEGMDAATCARKMLRAVQKEKEEVFIGGKEGLMLLIRRFFPSRFSWLIRNHPVKKLRRFMRFFTFRKRKSPEIQPDNTTHHEHTPHI